MIKSSDQQSETINKENKTLAIQLQSLKQTITYMQHEH